MRYVSLDDLIDPRGYLEELPSIAAELPPGARRFAADPEHYDFAGKHCVKDLKLDRIRMVDDATGLELFFAHNCWKHEDDLTIRYERVTSFAMDLALAGRPGDRRDVILDEILPHDSGCIHEIACHGGTVRITAGDLTATWTWADCPERS
jgi:hypothetical protein